VAVCAVLAGTTTFAAIADWATDLDEAARRRLGFVGRIPVGSTVWQFLIRIDAQVLQAVLTRWLRHRLPAQPAPQRKGRVVIAVDGKLLRGTRLPDGRQVHLLSAHDTDTGIVLAQVAIARPRPPRDPHRQSAHRGHPGRARLPARRAGGTDHPHPHHRCQNHPRDGLPDRHPARGAGPANQLGDWARREWHIENRLHRVRDVTLAEDAHQARTGNGPAVAAVLRNTAIGYHRSNGEPNIARAARRANRRPHDLINAVTSTTRTQ
jgi:hypothetical protein